MPMIKTHRQKTKNRLGFILQGGYILPTVIALGLAVATVNVVAMRAVTDGSTRLMTQYYDVLAREAAQAGVAAVKACVLSKPSSWAQTAATQISNTRPLTPITDCDGATDPAKSSNLIVGSSATDVETTYRVVQIEKAAGATTIYVTSIGEARIKAGARVVSTVSSTVKAMATSVMPVSGPVSKDISMVSTGFATACAVTNPPDSSVYCWGSNANLQLGTGRIPPTTAYTYPVGDDYNKPIAVATNAATLPAISRSGCTNGLPGCFGGTYRQPSVPEEPASALSGKAVTKVSVGATHVCAVATDVGGGNGKAYCWGRNGSGQLGNQSTTDSRVPVQVNDTATASALRGKTVVDVTAGNNFSCARTQDGIVTCWGANGSGQLGTDNRTNSNIPVNVSLGAYEPAVPRYCTQYLGFPISHICRFYNVPEAIPEKPASALIGKQVKALATLKGRTATMCVVTTDNKTVCWGENFAGQVGNGAALPPSASGNGSARSSNANACSQIESSARAEAVREAESNANVDSYVILRPTEVVTSLVFDSVSIFGGDDGDVTYVDVVGKVATTATTSPDKLFNWGGTIERDVSSSCSRNGDTYGSDHSSATARATVRFAGRSTPSTTPLYSLVTNAPLNGRLGLTAGNPVRGIFCATVLSMNQPYCDSHNGTANKGELGNNYSCTPGFSGFVYNSCSSRWATPQSVRLDIAADTSGPSTPVNISSRPITSIDSTGNGFTCMVAQASAWCWGLGDAGQIGDGANANRRVPTAANYSDSAIRVNGTSGGDPASWENPLWF